MKKLLALLLALVFAVSLFVSCSNADVVDHANPTHEADNGNSESSVEPENVSVPENASYLMIYNPEIYDGNVAYNPKKNTGSISKEIIPAIHRAEGLEEVPEYVSLPVNFFDTEIPDDKVDLSGDRAGRIIIPYKVGDEREFWHLSSDFSQRIKSKFTCVYAGTYCNMWVRESYDSYDGLVDVGQIFDREIYEPTIEKFCESRFANNGGKVNVLWYEMDGGYLGFFTDYDSYATGEVSQQEVDYYGLNLDHDIINLNVNTTKEFALGTLAHEYQHLLCRTLYFNSMGHTTPSDWLNEAMSSVAEESLYPDIRVAYGHDWSFNNSPSIRHGASIYNYANDIDDIGRYGTVWYFSEYFANVADDDVYSNLYDYWSDYSNRHEISDAEALAKLVDREDYVRIDSLVTYPSSLSFASEYDEWMSKLTLDFYIDMLTADSDDPSAFSYIIPQSLLYDEINPASIEGGGRVIVELKGDSFNIPEDADTGLVYVYLDRNFNVVGDIECK